MVSDSERRYTEMSSVTGRIKEIKQKKSNNQEEDMSSHLNLELSKS